MTKERCDNFYGYGRLGYKAASAILATDCIGLHMVGRRIAFSSSLLAGTRIATRVIDIATMSILARNLVPSDFGLVSVAMTLVLIAEAVFELPVHEALVRQATISMVQLDTAVTLSLFRGLVLSSIVMLLAWPFARFYAEPRLIALLCILSMAPFFRGIRSPRLAQYHKQMSFWRDMIIDLGGKCAGFAASVTVCLLTHSYWSIVFGTVAAPLAMTMLSYLLAPCRVRLSLAAMRTFSGFLGWMSVAQVISAISWQSDRLLLGKLVANREFGIFSAAGDLATIPITALLGPMLRPLLSAFSSLQSESHRLIRSYRVAATAIVTVGLPLLVGVSFVATPVVHILLGAHWVAAVPLLQWLALSQIPTLTSVAVGPLVMALNKTQIFVKINLIELSIRLPVLFFGVLEFGLGGAIVSRFAAALTSALCSLFAIRRLTGIGVMTQLSWFWRSAASASIMAFVLSIFDAPLQTSATLSQQVATLATMTLVGGFAYSAALWSFWALSGSPVEGVEHLITIEVQRWLGKATRLARPSS